MQFICFTFIGYTIIKKHNNERTIILYTVFAGVFYTTLLLLLQYTSVAALMILTSFILLVDKIENEENKSKWYRVAIFALFTLGVMTRFQSLLIIVPFIALYFFIQLIKYCKTEISKDKILILVKNCLIYLVIAIIIYVSNYIIYNTNEVYKNYTEYNEIRTQLNDIVYVEYEENKEIFDEIGWSKNDYYLFYTFNFGDENIYSKENLQKILDYKIQKDGKYNFNTDISSIIELLENEIKSNYMCIFLVFVVVITISLCNKEKRMENILIAITTIAVHILFIIINRTLLRVVIPEYIVGIAWIIYNLPINSVKEKINDSVKNSAILCIIAIVIVVISGEDYNFNYNLDDYKNYQEIIKYTSENKENIYLYTVPALQYRYLAYSVYEMPPKAAFSNLRVMGGWDMYTQNYYDFKDRYNLDGTFLDLLKDDVYLIDGRVKWSGNLYENYINNIVLFIKEHYNINAEYEKIKEFDNLYIYKLKAVQE
jgi:4-amino-4-deoxy-L-arabinose transferase-like glycosyltransferase